MQYVGQTNQQVSKRMKSHRFDINNFDSQSYASNIALHFNSYSHSIEDFSFLPIDVVKDEITRLFKETYWIHKLDKHAFQIIVQCFVVFWQLLFVPIITFLCVCISKGIKTTR